MEEKILIVQNPEDFLQMMEQIRTDYLKAKGLKPNENGVDEDEKTS